MIYANTTLRSGSLVSGTASQHVITADSVDSFKNRLDKFWANEEARFDYKANLSLCSVSALVIHYEEALYQVYVCTFIWQRFCKAASKSYVAFLLLCIIYHFMHRGLRPMPIVARLCHCICTFDFFLHL